MTLADARAYDARLFADARQLANLDGGAAIRAYFASTGLELAERDNAYAAALGRLQAVTHELLCTIARAADRDALAEAQAEAAEWTEYRCAGCGATYSALPFTNAPHRCADADRGPAAMRRFMAEHPLADGK